MKIVLGRHANAEHGFAKSDLERNLSPEGIKDIQSKASELLNYITTDDQILIWSSSANRAEQTARIIADTLGKADLDRVSPVIYHGELEKVLAQLATLDPNTMLFIIGHQPSMSYWASVLSGVHVSFSTGDLACFKITSLQPLSAKFIWKID